MKKILYILFFMVSILSFSNEAGLGIIGDAELRQAGVKEENIKKAKALMNEVSSSYQLKILEKRQLELQVNKYVLDGAEKYLAEIDKLFDKIGNIEASILKERVRSQIQMQKYITQEQYMKAREMSIKRLNSGK